MRSQGMQDRSRPEQEMCGVETCVTRPERPAGGCYVPWQVSWLTGLRADSAFPDFRPVACVESALAADSCGGSAGFAPASLLATPDA